MSKRNEIATKNEEEQHPRPFSSLNLPTEDGTKQELQFDNHHHLQHQTQRKRKSQPNQDVDEVHHISQSRSTRYVKDSRKDKYYIEENKATEYSKQLNSGPTIDSKSTKSTEVHFKKNESSGYAIQANTPTAVVDANLFLSSPAHQAPPANSPAPELKAEPSAPAPKKARKRGRHQRRSRDGSHAATERADHDSHDEPPQQTK